MNTDKIISKVIVVSTGLAGEAVKKLLEIVKDVLTAKTKGK